MIHLRLLGLVVYWSEQFVEKYRCSLTILPEKIAIVAPHQISKRLKKDSGLQRKLTEVEKSLISSQEVQP